MPLTPVACRCNKCHFLVCLEVFECVCARESVCRFYFLLQRFSSTTTAAAAAVSTCCTGRGQSVSFVGDVQWLYCCSVCRSVPKVVVVLFLLLLLLLRERQRWADCDLRTAEGGREELIDVASYRMAIIAGA